MPLAGVTLVTEMFRSFLSDLEIRSSTQGGDGRTVTGIAVPYGVEQRIDDNLVETFARGAFANQLRAPHRVKFSYGHMSQNGKLIGRATLLREDASGLYGEFRVSDTPAGNEALALIRDGALDELSIGFQSGQDRRLANGTIERMTAHLGEVAIVMQGAYGRNAMVSAVRAVEETAGTPNLDKAAQVIASIPMLRSA